MGQAYNDSDFSNIVVLTRLDGTRVTLGEIADIKDTFEEGDLLAAFNGAPAVMVNVSQVGSEDLIEIAADTKEIVAEFNRTLPQGIDTNIWIDTSLELEERMSVLLKTPQAACCWFWSSLHCSYSSAWQCGWPSAFLSRCWAHWPGALRRIDDFYHDGFGVHFGSGHCRG